MNESRSSPARVLVTGAGGLLGGRLALLLRERAGVVAARHVQPAPPDVPDVVLDLESEASIETALGHSRPDAVLHCAALADADECERDPEKARRINAHASECLARLCRQRGIRLIAVSTDLVFDGSHSFVRESEAPARPQLVYARTKLLGEAAVLAQSSAFVVLRVALVVGRGHGPRATASEGVAWAIANGRRPRLFTDQFRSPIDPESVADAVVPLLSGRGSGLYHIGGRERVSRYELGLRVARAMSLDATCIDPISHAAAPIGVPRPADVSMDSSRARADLGWQPRPLDDALRESRPRPD